MASAGTGAEIGYGMSGRVLAGAVRLAAPGVDWTPRSVGRRAGAATSAAPTDMVLPTMGADRPGIVAEFPAGSPARAPRVRLALQGGHRPVQPR
ncbi:hypothetical protein Asi03nite_67250 [Actinoplanes siamensis]|uniref:Uncharacterized protein n=1 Tax=Actinoplanes siamensis TaxID=1223317 RepID=A0A919TNX5_9ACTN|nr:hypothetical protein Asi03nite_67250 [Actinoplanes siamensis]